MVPSPIAELQPLYPSCPKQNVQNKDVIGIFPGGRCISLSGVHVFARGLHNPFLCKVCPQFSTQFAAFARDKNPHLPAPQGPYSTGAFFFEFGCLRRQPKIFKLDVRGLMCGRLIL